MKALVTGSAGFVGRHVQARLLDDGFTVTGVEGPGHPAREGHYFDALDLFQNAEERYDLVVHAAASSPHRRAIDTEPRHLPYNVQLDAAMLAWATRTRPGHVFYLSSSAVYPAALQAEAASRDGTRLTENMARADILDNLRAPYDTYGLTKLVGETMVEATRACGVPVTVLRPFSGYGEDQSEDFPFGAIVERARRHEDPLTVLGTGDEVRDWVHVDDVVEAIGRLYKTQATGTYNVCTGVGTSMLQLAQMAHVQAGYAPEVTTARQTDTQPVGQRPGVLYRVGSPSRLHRHYYPRVSLAEGIRRRLER